MNGQEAPLLLKQALTEERLKIERDPDTRRVTARLRGTDEELRALCHLETVEELNLLDRQNFTDAGLVDIGKLKKLQVLVIGGTRFTPTALAPLVDLPCLEYLSYSPDENTREAAQIIARLKHLKILDLSGAKFSDPDIHLICTNKSLMSLSLPRCPNLTDEALRDVGNLVNLRKLSLSDNPALGDKSCDYAAKCIGLRVLGIAVTQVSDRGVEKLMVLRELEELSLAKTPITAKSLDRLSGLPKLRYLSIPQNDNLGDEIVPFIKKCKSLDTLLGFSLKLSLEAQKEIGMSRKWKDLWLPYEGPPDGEE